MRDLFTNESLVIPAGQAVSGIAAHAQTLRVTDGRAWITIEGVAHDYWLCAGECFSVAPGRLIVIEADAAAGPVMASVEPNSSALGVLAWQLRRRFRRFARRATTESGRSASTSAGQLAADVTQEFLPCLFRCLTERE